MPIILDGDLGITTPALTVTGATVNTGGISTAGNLTFTSTGNRITGDFSNATITNRVIFQSSTSNGSTFVEAIPNGTSQVAAFNLSNNSSDTANSSVVNLYIDSTSTRIQSTIRGTGTFLPLAMYTGGSERLRIDTSGNVGIGTTSPDFKLEVVGGTNNGIHLKDAESATVYGGLFTQAANLALVTRSNHALTFGTNDTERMRIDSSGNVGIGTTSPKGVFDVVGTGASSANNWVYISGGNVGAQNPAAGFGGGLAIAQNYSSGNSETNIIWGNSVGSGQYLAIGKWTGSAYTEQMRISSTGNVGIGTNTPTSSLSVAGANLGTPTVDGVHLGMQSGYATIELAGSAATGSLIDFNKSGSDYLGRIFYANSINAMTFSTSSIEAMRISAERNLHIGYSSTGGTNLKLFVVGADSSGSNWSIYAQNSSAAVQFGLRNDNYLYCPAIGNYSVAGTTVVIDGGNYVGKLTSSLRYKKDIVGYDKGLDAIAKLRPVYYKSAIEGPNGVDPKQHAGFIAEEIADAGFEEFLIRNEEGEPDAIQYAQMTAILCKGIQEQQVMIEELKAKVAALEAA